MGILISQALPQCLMLLQHNGNQHSNGLQRQQVLKKRLFLQLLRGGFTAMFFHSKGAIPTSKTNPECVIWAKIDL